MPTEETPNNVIQRYSRTENCLIEENKPTEKVENTIKEIKKKLAKKVKVIEDGET